MVSYRLPWELKFFINTDTKGLRDEFVPLSTIMKKSDIDHIEKELADLEI
jgi:hypothetical protein